MSRADLDDRKHIAAAKVGRATVLLTRNLKTRERSHTYWKNQLLSRTIKFLHRTRKHAIDRRVDVSLASPGEYLTRELGERPDDPELDEVWRDGVGIVERFRFARDITHERFAFFGHNPREIRDELAPIKEELNLDAPSVGMRM